VYEFVTKKTYKATGKRTALEGYERDDLEALARGIISGLSAAGFRIRRSRGRLVFVLIEPRRYRPCGLATCAKVFFWPQVVPSIKQRHRRSEAGARECV